MDAFSVDYNINYTNNILDIHKYLMKIKFNNIMFGFIRKMFIALSSVCTQVNFSGSLPPKKPIKCLTLNNRLCQGRPRLVNI